MREDTETRLRGTMAELASVEVAAKEDDLRHHARADAIRAELAMETEAARGEAEARAAAEAYTQVFKLRSTCTLYGELIYETRLSEYVAHRCARGRRRRG